MLKGVRNDTFICLFLMFQEWASVECMAHLVVCAVVVEKVHVLGLFVAF